MPSISLCVVTPRAYLCFPKRLDLTGRRTVPARGDGKSAVASRGRQSPGALDKHSRVSGMADMRYRRLGNSGLVVSVVGLGCNNFGRKVDEAGTKAVVDAAIEHGINLFDTADVYGDPQGSSEEVVGKALR